MKTIVEKPGVCEEGRLPVQAVLGELTRVVIKDDIWSAFQELEQGGKWILPAFSP
jgi:hypothetical protein